MKVSGQVQPGRQGTVVEDFQPLLITELDKRANGFLKVVTEFIVKVTDAESILLAARDESFTAKSTGAKALNWIWVAVGKSPFSEKTPSGSRMCGAFIQKMIELKTDAIESFFFVCPEVVWQEDLGKISFGLGAVGSSDSKGSCSPGHFAGNGGR